MEHKGFELIMTCAACPEQYDLFLNKQRVGYFRLRHGYFYVSCPDVDVYDSYPKGDGLFEYDEREEELMNGINAVIQHLLKENKIVMVGCHDCKNERYTFVDEYFIECDNCSPYHPVFHFLKTNP